jgi:peptidoglycan/xylan/chitin deacetylase (PgdA/CDA1 family)
MRAILTFHSIDSSGSVLSCPRDRFETLLRALEKAKMPIMTIGDLLRNETRRGVALTFDDGMKSVLTDALPVLTAFSAPAHLFLSTGFMGGDNRWPGQPPDAPVFDTLDWNDVEALHAGGVHIEGHTISHPDLRLLSDSEIEAECCAANEHIRQKTGVMPLYFAFPYGYHDARVRTLTRRHYAACVTTELRALGEAEDNTALPRLDSYYLQSDYIQRNLATPLVRTYLTFRNILRHVRSRW